MKFDFIAVEKRTGRKVQSSITISDPVLVTAGRGDFSSAVTFEGFDDLSTRIYGACSFQAPALAFEFARKLMAARESRWEFHFGDDGPVTFDWPTS